MINNRFLLQTLRDVTSESLRHDRYELKEPIGQGGMAVVYRAIDKRLNRDVAVKIVRDDFAKKISSNAMLLQEANIIAKLEHPGIVPIHDCGEFADGTPFYVMQKIGGNDLSFFLRENTGLLDRLRVFERICETVAFAHENLVTHRDLKPQNIMLGTFGEVFVLDWGIAQSVSSSAPETEPLKGSEQSDDDANLMATRTWKTRHGVIAGTPAYMAPEAARGEVDQIGSSTDVFALGAILFLMLTDKMLIDQNVFDKFRAGDQVELPSPRERNRSIPRVLNAICNKATALETNERYQDANELRQDIRQFLNGEETSAYQTPWWEKAGQFAQKYQTFIWMIAAYLVLRTMLALLS